MPINFPDFSAPRKSALQSYLEGYSGFHTPMNMLQEQLQQRLGNERAQITNQYLPQRLSQEQEQMRLANIFNQAREPYAGQLARNEAELGAAQARNTSLGELGGMIRQVNDIVQQYGFNSPEAQQARQWLQSKVTGGQPFISEERRASLPEGAIPLESLSPGERNDTVKRMNEELKVANSSKSALKIVDELREIQNDHPKLGKYFATAITSGDEPGWLEYLARKTGFLSEKDVSALQKFRKLSNDLVVKGSESWGGRITDARMKLLSMTKPGAGNTAEANNYLFDRLTEELAPKARLGNKIKEGLKNRYAVYQDYSEDEPQDLSQFLSKSKGGNGSQLISLNGEQYDIPDELIEEFLADNPGAKRG